MTSLYVMLIALLVATFNNKCVESQLFDFPSPIEYNPARQSECELGKWSFKGTLELKDENLLKFFVPAVDVMVPHHKLCCIDLTSCPPDVLPTGRDSCYCSGKSGDVFHLYVSYHAQVEHSDLTVSAGLPLRYSWFRFSKVWDKTVGRIPKIERAHSSGDGSNATTPLPTTTTALPAVAGGYGNWSFDGECDGSQINLTRECNNPKPQNGGLDCVGDSFKTEPCANGNWSPWSAPKCNNLGTKSKLISKTRKCNNPEPSNGGKGCDGANGSTSRFTGQC